MVSSAAARRSALLVVSWILAPALASAAIDLAIEVGPDPAEPGESLRVALTVTHAGAAASAAVTLHLPFPAHLASLAESLISDAGACPGTTCDPSETIVWSLGSLAPGTGITVDLPPTVLGGAAAPPSGTMIAFAAEAFEGAASAATAAHAVTVLPARVFDLAIDEDRDPVTAGTEQRYALTFGNRSDETTTDTELTFALPAGTGFVSASDGGAMIGGAVRWDLGTLAGHEGGRRTVLLSVAGGLAEGTILEPPSASLSGEGDFQAHETRATSAIRVENDARALVALAINPDPARPGEALRTALMVSNPGAGFAHGVVLRLRLPAGLASLSESLISDAGACPGTTCDPAETLTWALGSLPPGRGVTVTLPPAIAAPPGGTVLAFPIQLDVDGSSRTQTSQSVIVRADRVLDLSVEAERSPVGAGRLLDIAAVFGNRSAGTTTDTVLRLPLPAGTSFVAASDGGAVRAGSVTWSLGTLGGHEGGQRRMTVRVGSGVGEGRQLAIDPATIDGRGTFLAHQTRSRTLGRVEDATRLDLAVAVDRDPVVPGEALGVRIAAVNRSAVDFADNVTLRLRYPVGFASLGESLTTGGACAGTTCDPTETVTFLLGSLPPGGGAVVELPPTVAATTPGGAIITVNADLDATDRSRTRAAHPVLVRTARVLDLAVDVDADPVPTAGMATYDVSFGNRGAEAIAGASLRLPVPRDATFLGASDGGIETDGAVVWDLGVLAARETGRRRAAFSPSASTGGGLLLRTFDAEISGTGTATDPVTRARDARRVETVTLELTVDAAPEPVEPSGVLDTMLRVTNRSPSFLFGTVLQLRYPTALSSLSESLVSDGGACPGTTCDGTELVTWNLGDLAPGATIDVSLPPLVAAATPDGSLIRFWAHAFAASFGTAAFTRSIAVGSDFGDAGPIQVTHLFGDGFESGDTSAWSQTVP